MSRCRSPETPSLAGQRPAQIPPRSSADTAYSTHSTRAGQLWQSVTAQVEGRGRAAFSRLPPSDLDRLRSDRPLSSLPGGCDLTCMSKSMTARRPRDAEDNDLAELSNPRGATPVAPIEEVTDRTGCERTAEMLGARGRRCAHYVTSGDAGLAPRRDPPPPVSSPSRTWSPPTRGDKRSRQALWLPRRAAPRRHRRGLRQQPRALEPRQLGLRERPDREQHQRHTCPEILERHLASPDAFTRRT
jgi:hypothetical protein